MRVLAAFGLGLALLVAAPPLSGSAADREGLRKKPTASYFPLEVGNWWVYEGRLGIVSVRDRITAPNGLKYFALDGMLLRENLVRLSRPDVVSELNADGGEDSLWYMLGAPVGTTWEFELSRRIGCYSGVSVTVASRTDVVKVPAGEFKNVVRLERGPVCCDCGIQVEWFAPGVGLIRRKEMTIEGAATSELVEAQVGGVLLRRPRYDTFLSLDRPFYGYNLFPPVSPDSFPTVRAVFVLRNESSIPLQLSFLGCKTVTFTVLNAAGVEMLQVRGSDYDCFTDPVVFTLANGSLPIEASFTLKTAGGLALPDGRYTLVATLDTTDPLPLRPSARAVFDVTTNQ